MVSNISTPIIFNYANVVIKKIDTGCEARNLLGSRQKYTIIPLLKLISEDFFALLKHQPILKKYHEKESEIQPVVVLQVTRIGLPDTKNSS